MYNGGGLVLLEKLKDSNARRSAQPNNDAAVTFKLSEIEKEIPLCER